MSIDLSNIRDNDLIRGSYSEIIEIIDALEGINAFRFSGVSAIETLEAYRSYAYIIKGRILSNEFKELSSNDSRREKTILHSRLNVIIDHISSSLEINGLLNEQTEYITNTINKAKKELSDQKKAIEKEAKLVQKQIDKSEHTILSHVLSIMGVFSAIITIILSVIITSSSWLNNANGASAIIAFVVPNLVTLLAVFVLLSLVFFYLHRDTSDSGEKCAQQKRSRAFTLTIAGILISVIMCCWLCLSSITQSPDHARYIIPSEQYKIVDYSTDSSNETDCTHETDCDCHIAGSNTSYFEFIFNGIPFKFEYNESLLHDGNLYFCTEHNSLE